MARRSHRAVGSNQHRTRYQAPDTTLVGVDDCSADADPLETPGHFDDLLASPDLAPVISRFAAADVPLYLVGGSVRDRLAGHPAKDLDLCTPADPDQIAALMKPLGTTTDVGAAFGTVVLHRPDVDDVEITQFRGDVYRPGSRRPDVHPVDDIAADLQRRDFTVNAIAVDTVTGQVIDPYGGTADLAAGRLRTPGDPNRSFADDPLRVARLVRFAATRGWTPTSGTLAAAYAHRESLNVVSAERFQAEAAKVLASPRPEALTDALLWAARTGAADHLFAGLSPARLAQKDLARLQPHDRLAALVWSHQGFDAGRRLHAAKWPKFDTVHALGVTHAIREFANEHDQLRARRLIRTTPAPVAEAAIRVADVVNRQPSAAVVSAAADAAWWRRPLEVTGNDAIAAGIKPGPAVGEWLRRRENALLASPRR